MCGDGNKEKARGKKQIKKKKSRAPTRHTPADPSFCYCGGSSIVLSAGASSPRDLNQQGREGAGPGGGT